MPTTPLRTRPRFDAAVSVRPPLCPRGGCSAGPMTRCLNRSTAWRPRERPGAWRWNRSPAAGIPGVYGVPARHGDSERGVVAAVVVVATDGSGSGSGRPQRAESGVSGRSLAVPTARRLPGGCPVTRARWRPRSGLREGRLWIAFRPTGGVYRVPAENVARDGSLGVKIAWQRGRGLRGRVTVEGRRLDGRAPAVRRRISSRGYGLTGLQASGIAFPTHGCWTVTASAWGR
jgi:hypothetical protein